MERVKDYWVIIALSVAAVVTIGANVVVGAFLYSLLADSEIDSCGKEEQELKTVASIANATGRLPDGRQIETDEKITVNPDYCK